MKPTFFQKAKNFVRRLLGIKKKIIVDRIIKESEVQTIDKELLKERAYKDMQLALKDKEIQELKEKFKPDKDIDVKQFLSKQQKSLYIKKFSNSLSLKKLLNGGNVSTLSYDLKRKFGELDDIIIMTDGRVAIISKREDKKFVTTMGRSVKDIFWNFKGLRNSAVNNFLTLCLDHEGSFVKNIFDEEIPEVAIDLKGNMHITQVNMKSYMEQLIEKESKIGELINYISVIEDALGREIGDNNLKKIMHDYATKRAETAESETLGLFEKQKDIMAAYYQMTEELNKKGVAIHLGEDLNDKLETIKSELLEKLESKEGKETKEVVEESFRKTLNFLTGVMARVPKLAEREEKPELIQQRATPREATPI